MRKQFRLTPGMRSRDAEEAALAFAKAGLPVVLLFGTTGETCDCGKPDCGAPGKHPISSLHPRGHKDATVDHNDIAKGFARFPNANYGVVPLGSLLIIDADGPEGETAVAALGLPVTMTVKTHRGHHYYFTVAGFAAEKLPKLGMVDYRHSANGYVVGPGSRHVRGTTYRLTGRGEEVASVDMTAFGKARKLRVDFSPKADKIAEGGRNNELTRIAGALRAFGASQRAISRALKAVNEADCSPPLPSSEVEKIAASVSRYPSARERMFSDIADVEVEKVEWLYAPYLPRGVLVMLDGRPGLGKSNFVAALAAALTTGRQLVWSESAPRGRLVILSAEDDAARILKPRLLANGANVSPGQIRFAQELFSLDEKGIELLRAEVASFQPDLVVIDPIIAFIGAGAELNKATDMTRFMTEIDKIAREFNCTILIIRHLRKSGDGDAMMQGIGSVAIAGRVRSMLVMGKHPDDPKVRAVAHAKSNYGPEGKTFTFTLSDGDVPAVQWLGIDETLDADHLVQPSTPNGPGRPPEQSEAVRMFLETYLAETERPSTEVFTQAKARALANVTVRRVAREMGVIMKRVGVKSFWRLPMK